MAYIGHILFFKKHEDGKEFVTMSLLRLQGLHFFSNQPGMSV